MRKPEKKIYGIYHAYPPGVQLQGEGLGRFLIALLRGASSVEGVRFKVVCYEENKQSLLDLCLSEHIDTSVFDIVCPSNTFILRVRSLMNKLSSIYLSNSHSNSILNKHEFDAKSFIKEISNYPNSVLTVLTCIVMPLVLVLSPLIFPIYMFINFMTAVVKATLGKFKIFLRKIMDLSSELKVLVIAKQVDVMKYRLIKTANGLDDVLAWYAPTAFWPEFNKIIKPKIMCVPDMVLSECPVGFAMEMPGAKSVMDNIEDSVRGGQYFVTYSEHIKFSIMSKLYGIDQKNVFVIPHPRSDLSHFLEFDHEGSLSAQQFFKSTMAAALKNAIDDTGYVQQYDCDELNYLFYPTQFRSSKNILTLLRAFDFLIKTYKYQGKLILTGNVSCSNSIRDFVDANKLRRHVFFLHKITATELAVCYKKADLVVSTTLVEGGFPFTCTEAMSVGTPVLTAKVPIVLEFIKDFELQNSMMFDPYDYMDLADRIVFVLQNRSDLILKQQSFYQNIMTRTWGDVALDYISLLDTISSSNKAG